MDIKWKQVLVVTIMVLLGVAFFQTPTTRKAPASVTKAFASEVSTPSAPTVSVPTTITLYSMPAIRKGIKAKQAYKIIKNNPVFKYKVRYNYSWKKRGRVTAVSPKSGQMYPAGTLCTIVINKRPPLPQCYHSNKHGVKRWRPMVRWFLNYYGIWNKGLENRIINCIRGESGGNPYSTSPSGNHHGILQMTTGWSLTKGNRKFCCKSMRDNHLHCGKWEIMRLCRGYKIKMKQGGTAAAEAWLHSQWQTY